MSQNTAYSGGAFGEHSPDGGLSREAGQADGPSSPPDGGRLPDGGLPRDKDLPPDKGLPPEDPFADSLMTRDESAFDTPGDEARVGAQSAAGDDTNGYELTFAPGQTIDRELLRGFTAEARDMGISSRQAQRLADFYSKHAASAVNAADQARNAAYLKAKKGWEAEIMARPEFRQEYKAVGKTLKAFGSPELEPLLRQSMLGSHPAFFDFMVAVGKALGESDSRRAGYGSFSERTLADRLWPGMQ